MSKLVKTAEECSECHDPNAYYSMDGIECPNESCPFYSEQQYNDVFLEKLPMVEQLIELADVLDSMGYVKLADKVDEIISNAYSKQG